ncbi:MAG: hypothetical protein IJW59_05305 [Clostridia bacterium]|nr:hypothetical protein [Clostridia bacterium]
MFVERFSDEQAVIIAKKYLHMVDNELNPDMYIKSDFMKRRKDFVTFTFDVYHHYEEWVTLQDFNITVSWSGKNKTDRQIQKEYLKDMYRMFGKEYLDALDIYGRKPIEEEYNAKLEKHNAMIQSVMEEEK